MTQRDKVGFNWDDRAARPVMQGEFKISDRDEEILTTILGSCIAACIFDPVVRVGGINHFLLPEGADNPSAQNRYGAFAMEALINALIKSGASRQNMQAKLFGGAKVASVSGDIGALNSHFARAYLSNEGIACVSSSLGGELARRIHFHPTSGRARQFLLPPNQELPSLQRRPEAKEDIVLF